MRVTVLRGVFISSFGTFCVNVAGGPAGGWLLIIDLADRLSFADCSISRDHLGL